VAVAKAHPKLNFARLIRATKQRSTEVERAETRKSAIRTRLRKSFKVANIVTIGSYSRGTAIANYSDVDLLANLRRDEAKWGDNLVSSSRVLQRVRDDLNDRFVSTDVRRDGQAAVVYFARGKQKVDVVPGIFLRMHEKSPVFGIPDGSGGWLETSPRAHLVWLRRKQLRSRGKMNKVIQILKYWKYCRGNTQALSSFYLEMWLANSGLCVGVRSYSEILLDAFYQLHRESLKRISDPVGVSGLISPARTRAHIDSIGTTIHSCLGHATAAIEAETRRDFQEANRQWSIVFNGIF